MDSPRTEKQAHRAFRRYQETGDPAAITAVFDLTAPILLGLAVHVLGDRAQAEDVVQTTFLEAIEAADRFDAQRPLLPWLSGILIHHVRRERRRAGRRVDAERVRPRESVSPADLAAAREFTELVTAALEQLPKVYREVLELRLTGGFEPREIAVLLKRRPETVKTQLVRGLARLRQQVPETGFVALAVLFGGSASAGTASAALRDRYGVGPGHQRTRLGRRGAMAITLGAVTLLLWVPLAMSRNDFAEREGAASAPPERVGQAGDGVRGATGDATRAGPVRHVVAREPRLAARVRWSDGSVASGLVVSARPAEDSSWLREMRATTDAEGVATFSALGQDAGAWLLRTSRGEPPSRAVAGLGEVELTVPEGISVAGVVLNQDGGPVPGARLWLAPPWMPLDAGAEVGTTSPDGSFRLRDVPAGSVLGALADGLAGTPCIVVGDGPEQRVELRTQGRAPVLKGTVRAPDGSPVAGAAVMVGRAVHPRLQRACPPHRARTGADGGFACANQWSDLANPIWVGAPGFVAHMTTPSALDAGTEFVAQVALQTGVRIEGVVTRSDRTPVAGAHIEVRQADLDVPESFVFGGPQWARIATRADEQGRFDVVDVQPGEVKLFATGSRGERVVAKRRIGLAATTSWDVVLPVPVRFRGRLLDRNRTGQTDWDVELRNSGAAVEAISSTRSDGEGRFEFDGCVPAREYALAVRQRGKAVLGEFLSVPVSVHGGEEIEFELPDWAIAESFASFELQLARRPSPDAIRVVVHHTNDEWMTFAQDYVAQLDGNQYLVGPLMSGRYEFRIEHRDVGQLWMGPVDIGPRQQLDLGRFTCEVPGQLRVRARGPGGSSVVPEKLSLSWDGHPSVLALHTYTETELFLQPGEYHVAAIADEGAHRRERVVIAPGTVTDLVLDLEPAARFDVRFRGIATPRFWVHLSWYRDATLIYQDRLVVRHRHQILPMALRYGGYRVVAEGALGGVTETSFTVGPGDRRDAVTIRVSEKPDWER
ncbi:MAG: sigma-70 family RNA polymerase sigma factor [Planctomycetota bacterium]